MRKVTSQDILNWHGSDHGIEELAETMADILNKEYSISLARKEILDLSEEEIDTSLLCERLSRLICDDEDKYTSMEEALNLLKLQAEIDGSAMADDVVLMWEKVEYSFTVNELLSEIGL